MSARSILSVIADAVADAARSGGDEIHQYMMAVRAARAVEPERPAASVAQLVNGLLENRDTTGLDAVAPSTTAHGGHGPENTSKQR